MKANAQSLGAAAMAEKGWLMVFSELTKARLTFLVALTTLVGFYVGFRGAMDYLLMFHTLLGTGLVASGASALNQLLEWKYDALMQRTRDRPLPSGRLQPDTVLWFGTLCSAAGLLYLAFAVNLLTSVLGAITLCSYLFIYTPLKRVRPLNTAIGAIPGALSPLMGWTAARNEINVEACSLVAVLFFWQLPHFLAIAWMYREDYARAGYAMLPVLDPGGQRTARRALSHTLGLLPISLCPFLFRMEGFVYLAGALVLSLAFVWQAIQFSRQVTFQRARRLFYASIIYLPLWLGLMVWDKTN